MFGHYPSIGGTRYFELDQIQASLWLRITLSQLAKMYRSSIVFRFKTIFNAK